MSPPVRLLTVILSLALGLGVWAASFSYQAATFADGEVLSAAALNDLLNDNFQAASDAVDERVHKDGDTMSGPLVITAEPVGFHLPPKPPEGVDLLREVARQGTAEDDMAALYAVNTAPNASAAHFINADEDSFLPVLALSNPGTGPALAIKSSGTGPLIQAQGIFEVTATGSIRLGEPGNPSLVLDAEEGTITNAVGSGLPLAYGRVAADGAKVATASTTNWSSTHEVVGGIPRYRISIDGVSHSHLHYATLVTPAGPAGRGARATSIGGDLLVYIYDGQGNAVDAAFFFMVFRPGS